MKLIKVTKIFLLILVVAYLSGCAARKHNIKLADSFWENPKNQVVIAKTKFEKKPGLHKIGQQGLLDYAVNSMVAQTFDGYLQKIKLDWYQKLPQKFADQLKKRNISSEVYSSDINAKQRKNAVAAVQLDGDKLLLLELVDLGAIRSYFAFMPSEAPKAYCMLKGELIDQQDKKVLWRHLAKIEEPVRGNWDQPPSYPNFTMALKQAVDSAQEEIVDSFFSGH